MPRVYNTSHHAGWMAIGNALIIGDALMLLGRTRKYAEVPLAYALAALRPGIQLNQYRIVYAPDGSPTAMLTWGWISVFTLTAHPIRPICALAPGEWNEGVNLCIFDLLSPPELVPQLVADFLDDIATDEMTIHTYPTLRDGESHLFNTWRHDQRAELIVSLGGA